MNNSLYLKRYVETHPDNKMAWYLLGKEYEQAGEQGKANYCYNKAEGVYEAFELSQVPSDIWKNYEQRLLEMEKDKERKRKEPGVCLRRWCCSCWFSFRPPKHRAPLQESCGRFVPAA